MKRKKFLKGLGMVLIASFVGNGQLKAADTPPPAGDVQTGKQYFEGSKRFQNSGPACISCHNVKNNRVIPGGLLAKDLTDVYDRMGEGLSGWLSAPPFPAMASSYQEHPLTSAERNHLTAFFKHVNDVKSTQKAKSGADLFYIGGSVGLLMMFLLISIIWMKRKRQMVKREIFDRQIRAWDAKH